MSLFSLYPSIKIRVAKHLLRSLNAYADDVTLELVSLFHEMENRAQDADPCVMPLARAINSSNVCADFLDGPNTIIQSGSCVSSDSRIGRNSYVGYNCMITGASIGGYVSIGNGVFVGPGEHNASRVSTSAFFYADPISDLTTEKCVIDHDVWIGNGCTIRRGIKVGLGAVVGANSFVNRDVEPFMIVAGSPARNIRSRFNSKVIDLIMKSEWWLLPDNQVRAAVNLLEQRIRFLDGDSD